MLPRFITDSYGTLLFVLLITSCLLLSDSATPRLVVPQDAQCACVGRVITYTCTAVGRGSTLWTGTVFDCTNNWINLRHSLFNDSNRGATGDCSDGALVGQSIGVTDNCYTSQLRVRIAADMDNETIRCDYRPGTDTFTIGQSTLSVITAALPPPDDVRPVRLLRGNLTFQWTSVAPACSSNLEYRINPMNCGNCVLSSTTSATCYNIPQPMTACNFSVQSVVCGDQIGGFSSPVEITLKVPDVPHVNILPVYSNDGRISATKVMITNNQTVYFYTGFSVPVSRYGVSFRNFSSNIILNSVNVSPCVDDICEYLLDVFTFCYSTSSISIAVSAANELGVGSSSNPMSVECSNNLVRVTYDRESSTITCAFHDPQNITDKTCIVEYGVCDSQQVERALEGSSTPESPNTVNLTLQFNVLNQPYCYNVTASNVSYTVIVMGRIGMDGGNSNHVPIIIVAIVVTILAVALVVVIVLILCLCIQCRHKNKETTLLELSGETEQASNSKLQSITGRDRIRDELKLRQVEDGYFECLCVDSDSQLREFLLMKEYEFKRGHAYYEFKHEVEHISEDKELVFMKDNKYFLPSVDHKILKKYGYLGEKIERPKIQEYKLFVQSSSGSGARHLPADSMLLYRKVNIQKEKQPSLRPLFTDHFKITKVDSRCTLKEFCKQQGIPARKVNVFLELDAAKEGDKIRDVLLANRVTCEQQPIPKLYTGPHLRLLDLVGLTKLQEKYTVFFVMESPFKNELHLEEDSLILHERRRHHVKNELFHVLEVRENNVQMSAFINKELYPRTFENGRAFYEFTGKEDFIYYKEVVTEQKTKMTTSSKTLSVQPDVSGFYSLSKAVPGLGITPPDSQSVRKFIQSTSYGSRCLKAGTTVLYKMDNELEQSTKV